MPEDVKGDRLKHDREERSTLQFLYLLLWPTGALHRRLQCRPDRRVRAGVP